MARHQPKSNYDLSKLIELHLDNNAPSDRNTSHELEVRFGTKGIKNITKIDFINVVSKLKSLDYTSEYGSEQGIHTLKIQSEFIDPKSGVTKTSNVRLEINGLSSIQKYCNSNSIKDSMKGDHSFSHNLSMLTKKNIKNSEGFDIRPVDVNPFNFRISYQQENKINIGSQFAKSVISDIDDTKKMFRLVNRVSFTHPSYPVRVDLSIVKSSSYDKTTRKHNLTYKMNDSNVLSNPERYEIEIEILNHLIGPGTKFDKANMKGLEQSIKTVITHILSGLQGTNYPVSYDEQNNVKKEYLELLYGKDTRDRYVNTKDFCGPSSYTLQMKNIQELSEEISTPNIRNYYTVTEKADGMRKMLFVNGKGKLYLITTNMSIQYTGVSISNKKLYNSLIDGEHVLHNKLGQFINYYGAFDVYYINGRSVREKGFMYIDEEAIKEDFRLPLLIQLIDEMNIKKDSKDMKFPINIQTKNFLVDTSGTNIFGLCGELLKRINSNYFEYETDGLIFTPIKNGVSSNKEGGHAGSLRKPTWDYSFKWKPPQYNTIDFLVTTKKSESNMDVVGNIFNSGTDLSKKQQISHYKIIKLNVGFDQKKHGFINPCNDVINDNVPKVTDIDDDETYKPMPFYPTNPSDPETHLCRILLKEDESGNYQMITEEGEVFDDKTIVEFKYDFTREKHYNWVPLRVRYDKTTAFKNNEREYGNAYHVANSNWYSIHNPISSEMLSTGDKIPNNLSDDGVYYNRHGDRSVGENTRCLRHFHNKYVKNKLIKSVSKRGNTLIDFAVGKAGDMLKWIDAKLDFVFGIDVSPDNIENMLDGACARYLKHKKEFKVMPKALFVNGNSGDNIKNGTALFSEKDRMITNAVFGNGPKDVNKLGKGVYNQYGKGSQGFNISSCQFALHYFFEDKDKLSAFVTNVCEGTKLNGYFIGTCYDGKKIFNSLKKKKKGESLILMNGDVKVWEVEKLYGNDEFNNDITSLGYDIKVYQESINKEFIEFLVNFDYFTQIMERFGFALLSDSECKEIGLPRSVGSFEDLFTEMVNEVKRNKKIEKEYGCSMNMTHYEKQISFYNNYFVFKKVHEVDPSELQLVDTTLSDESVDIEKIVEEVVDNDTSKPKTKSKKQSKGKLVLKES
jgi:hypothetical protein